MRDTVDALIWAVQNVRSLFIDLAVTGLTRELALTNLTRPATIILFATNLNYERLYIYLNNLSALLHHPQQPHLHTNMPLEMAIDLSQHAIIIELQVRYSIKNRFSALGLEK